MSEAQNVLKIIKDQNIKFVDFRFTDPRGKWHHTAQAVRTIDEDIFNDGIMFDGSSINGWKEIHESDMILMPDLSTVVVDVFSAQPTLIISCNVIEPSTGQPYDRCPRGIAERAQAYLEYSGIGDTAYFGPEAEFFVFDDVRFETTANRMYYSLDQEEGPYNSGRKYEGGNTGHRPGQKGGYFPVAPVDSMADIRAEMLTHMESMGIQIEKHHHEVAPSQNELGFQFDTMLRTADLMQIYKYVVHQTAHSYGKTATFMPKPIADDNGSGMHVHQSIWKAGKPIFSGTGYADLSDNALYYIGGIIAHARALNAFTNPSTNSYKRLVPGFEAPVLLAYSAHNRSASCRIPYAASPNGKRIEVRFPDPSAKSYLAFAAMLLAGIDGIENKIHPGDAMDKNLYDLPPEELKNVSTVCLSLREALESLENDRSFLKKGEAFADSFIDGYIELKSQEVEKFEQSPHPIEYQMYYSV